MYNIKACSRFEFQNFTKDQMLCNRRMTLNNSKLKPILGF